MLRLDATAFAPLKILSEIYAERDQPEVTVSFLRRALESYPPPIEPIAPRPVTLAKGIVRILSPRRPVTDDEFGMLEDPNVNDRKWYAWAMEYLAWYEGLSGGTATPVLH